MAISKLEQDIFGKYSSGKGNLAKDRKKLIKQILIAKHPHTKSKKINKNFVKD